MQRDLVVTSDNAHCYDDMTYHAEYICPDTNAIHDGDPLDCPDRLAVRRTDGTNGLLVHDGGSSSISIGYCPWCESPCPLGDIPGRRLHASFK